MTNFTSFRWPLLAFSYEKVAVPLAPKVKYFSCASVSTSTFVWRFQSITVGSHDLVGDVERGLRPQRIVLLTVRTHLDVLGLVAEVPLPVVHERVLVDLCFGHELFLCSWAPYPGPHLVDALIVVARR